ncbi:hypothetical protein LTR08_007104 [Meristemomyces frigidus]|nr:hypothetical protein LTR08_007104 [Meristemomyces frigidus]
MRVLKTSLPKPGEYALRFEEDFVPGEKKEPDGEKQPYAILSHAWEDDEVLFTDVINETAVSRKGFRKLERAIDQARRSGYPYLWADMACIDKRHSAELQEAINSMYSWYRQAEICLVYLADVPSTGDVDAADSDFVQSRWFKRGWTLQELIAPEPLNVEFFSTDWEPLGNRISRSNAIQKATRIEIDILEGRHPVEAASIAKRMSWAANRKTKRPEDLAYCLMGLFSVNMPMLYGEGGRKAFLRLQEEIMRNSDDHSIFAWVDQGTAELPNIHGLLADSPAAFKYPEASSIMTYSPWGKLSAYAMTNRGLDIQLHLTPVGHEDGEGGRYAAALDCPHPQTQSGFLAICLKKLSQEQDQFVRVDCHKFAAVRERGELTSVLVPQIMPEVGRATIYPLHMFLLRTIDSGRSVRSVTDVQRRVEFDTSDRRLLGTSSDRAYKIAKEESQWAAAIHLSGNIDGCGVAILLGTQGRLEVGFAVVEADDLGSIQVRDMKEGFDPKPPGSTVHLCQYDVRVDMQARARRGIKTYEVNVTIRDRDEGQQSPREPRMQAISTFTKGVLDPTPGPSDPTSGPSEPTKRREKLYRAVGLRR